nr:unnamed protein product [Digitaria exilis]
MPPAGHRLVLSYDTLLAATTGSGPPSRPSGERWRPGAPPIFAAGAHSRAVRLGLCSNAFVGSALVWAYQQCGDGDAMFCVFKEMDEPGAVCWNVHAEWGCAACCPGGCAGMDASLIGLR